jgi:hypothetical protein
MVERLWDERGRGVPFDQTSMAKLIDELEQAALRQNMANLTLGETLAERELELAEALGEVSESDEGVRSPGLSWEDLVGQARDLREADAERGRQEQAAEQRAHLSQWGVEP